MKARLEVPRQAIAEFCRKWRVKELSIFGSALREDFRPDSDVDILVTVEPGVRWGFQQWLTMTRELEVLFGRKVDLAERRLIEQSENYIRRRHILANLERVYVA